MSRLYSEANKYHASILIDSMIFKKETKVFVSCASVVLEISDIHGFIGYNVTNVLNGFF